MLIPYVGVIISAFFMLTFTRLFNSYSVGLLYSDAYKINKNQENIKYNVLEDTSKAAKTDVLEEYEKIEGKKEDTIDSMYGEKDE